ncbi:sporulation-specific protein 15-like [Nicotiana sylvestris]|uniref:sporulation-specific protein 15-like n=1 Tax=Nicotiana sylvestris TaxID=4096 RepID=UPI00388CB2F0
MKDNESTQDMLSRFTSIINELHSLGDVIPRNKLVRKILSILPGSWESKVNAITKAKDLQTLTIDELIGNLKTYEMKRKKDNKRREPKKKKNLVLKAESSDSSDEDSDMAYLSKRFQKMVRRNCSIPKRGSSNKRFNRKSAADNTVKPTLVAWGDSCSESEKELDAENSSMMAVETEVTKYDSLFALMAQSDKDEEDGDDEVNFRDVQRNMKSYSSKKLRSLVNVLIDAYYILDNDKEILTFELGEAEQSRDDLVVCVVDLNKTIANLEKEKEALNEKITSVENERDDMMEKHTLEETISAIEQERDDFLVIITNLEETIEGLNSEHRTVSLGKGKEVASETHIKLEHELNDVKTSLCGELKKNRQLQAKLEKVKIDLEKSLKWTWSSDAVIDKYSNNSENRQGIGFQREKTPYNPHSKYLFLITGCVPTVGTIGTSKKIAKPGFNLFRKIKWNSERKQIAMNQGKWILKARDWKHHRFLLTENPARKELCIKSDHRTEYDNAKFEETVTKMESHTTSQHQGLHRKMVLLKERIELEDMAWTILIDNGIAKSFWAKVVNIVFYLVNRKDQLGKFNSEEMKESFWDTLHKAKATKSTTKVTLSGRKCSLVQNNRTKHIEGWHCLLRVNMEKRLICGESSRTEDQIPDTFTKALSREYSGRNKEKMGS